MPVLARAKRRVAAGIGSLAMRADSKQVDFCMYLSAILLGGLLLNALFGCWWAAPVAGLVMVIAVKENGVAWFSTDLKGLFEPPNYHDDLAPIPNSQDPNQQHSAQALQFFTLTTQRSTGE